MNEDRFERDLREVLLEDSRGSVSAAFRERIAAVSRAPAAGRRSSRLSRIQPVVSGIAAAAAIVLVGGLLLVGRPAVGPAPRASASPSPTASPEHPSPSSGLLARTWATVPETADLAGASFGAVLASGGRFIAVGETGPTSGVATAWTSPDGVRWTKHDLPTPETGPSAATHVLAGPNGPLAFGTRMNAKGETIAVVWSSPDVGTVWKETDLPAPPPLAPSHRGIFQPTAAASGPAGVAVIATCSGEAPGPLCPDSTYLWQSADGSTWQLVTFPEQRVFLASLVAAGPGFVAGGARNSGRDPAIWTSSDGVTWSSVGELPDSPRAPNGDVLQVTSIGVGPDGIVALSPHVGISVPARAWASSDGRTWQLLADLTDQWFGLYSQPIWTSVGFLAVGWTAPGVTPPAYPDPFIAEQHKLLLSPDGTNWQPLPSPQLAAGDVVHSIAPTADRIVAVSVHAILVSPASLVSTGATSPRVSQAP